ncbi:MAG: tyrosine-type recombinase/integrase [Aeromonas sp.]
MKRESRLQSSLPATARLAITDTNIKRLQADHSIRQLSEPGTQLLFRYGKDRQSGTFHLRHYQGSLERWEMVARWPDVSSKEARRIYRTMKANLYTDPKAPAIVDRFDTVADLLKWFEERTAKTNPARAASLGSISRRHLVPRLGELPITSLTKPQVDELLIQPMTEEHSASYVRAAFNFLRLAYTRAHTLNLITDCPIGAWRYKDFNAQPVGLKPCAVDPSSLPGIVDGLPPSGRRRMLPLLMLLWGTRIGETLALRWSWVDWVGGVVRIPAPATKTREELTIPLTPLAIKELKAHKAAQRTGTNFLFPGQPGRSLDKSQAHREIKTVSRGYWSAHDLRKLARSIWADLGVDYMTGERLLNHKMKGLDAVYIHAQMEQQKADALRKYHVHLTNVTSLTK